MHSSISSIPSVPRHSDGLPRMLPKWVGRCVCLLWFLTLPAYAQSTEAESFLQAWTTGTPELSFRLRSETLQDDGKPKEGNALMQRSQLGWRSNSRHGLGFRVLLVSSTQLNSEFNDDNRVKTSNYPWTPAKDETDFTEAFVFWNMAAGSGLKLGRQKLDLDRTRFVGPNEFRQTQRFYQGVSAELAKGQPLNLFIGYFLKERGPDTFERETDFTVFRASYEWIPGHTLLGSAYLHDRKTSSSATAPSNKIQTVRADGKIATSSDYQLKYLVESGRQSSYANGTMPDTNYLQYGTSINAATHFLGVYQETLGGNGTIGFYNPLGLLHPTQGWADKFNSTPAKGVQDTWLSTGYNGNKWGFQVDYHQFKTAKDLAALGKELDVRLDWKFSKKLLFRAELAKYVSDQSCPATAATTTHISNACSMKRVWLNMNYAVW
ncbi:MAG: alginate export family protein [Limnohabitans sp.]